jgi:UPF0716 protein FxsA
MNSILLLIILIPVIEIYLFIKIGSQIGAIVTILLIFFTAIVGVYYAKYEGLNTLKSGFLQIRKNISPTYEMISGAGNCFCSTSFNYTWFCNRFVWIFNNISYY